MLRNERAKVMYVRHGWPALLVYLLASLGTWPARAQLIEGLDAYTDAVVGLSTTKWTGPRVPWPEPRPRPQGLRALDSRAWPLRVHAAGEVSEERLQAALVAAEDSFAALFAAGFLTSFGDAGQGGSAGRDLYLVGQASVPARADSDASGNFSALDGTRAFASVDAGLPADRLFACVARALVDAQLLEQDPAENEALRRGLAGYYGRLISGASCEDALPALSESPFSTSAGAEAWFERLSARQDRNRGTFLFDMWQFARQRTWEGRDLRASPDLIEAIAKALALAKEDFELVAGELAELTAEDAPSAVDFAGLPVFPDKRAPALAVLGSSQLRVELGAPRPGTRLRVWARGEPGGRYTLSAVRRDRRGRPVSRLELAPRRDPNGQLSVELDADTYAVSFAVTRVADVGLPDPDAPDPQRRAAGLIVDTPR